MMFMLFFFQTLLLLSFGYSKDSKKPNVLFVLGDDWGWNDFSFSGASNVETPNLQYYQSDGIYFFHYYTLHICTPARASLLSGRYASNIGMQHDIWNPGDTWAMPQDLTLLPERLKQIGYNTHMIGKWHLGFPSWSNLPNQRGFDSFMGYLNGEESYYTKNLTYRSYKHFNGIDFRYNNEPYYDSTYSTWLFTDHTLDILRKETKNSDPFFIYASYQAIHSPNDPPKEYYTTFQNCGYDENRCKITAMTYVFDLAFGKIMNFLKKSGMWENTLVIFSNDNGGALGSGSSNWPLRGAKGTFWEGGFRTHSFITGGVVPKNRKGVIVKDLFHVSDWYPTILSFIGDNEFIDSYEFDGIDQTQTILYGTPSKRNEILLNLDTYHCDYDYCAALIYKNFKLVKGNYVQDGARMTSGWIALENQKSLGDPTVECDTDSAPLLRIDETVCPWNGEACLYNLETDPCEYQDVKDQYPDMYHYMLDRFAYYKDKSVTPLPFEYTNEIDEADPENFDGYWTPWKDKLADVVQSSESTETSFSTAPSRWYKKFNFLSCML